MRRLRFKTKYIDVLIRYVFSQDKRFPKVSDELLDGIITFKVDYPFLSNQIIEKYSNKLQIEFIEDYNRVYFASSPSVILPSRYGGKFTSTFVHPTYREDITENMRKYVNILSDLDNLITEAYEELHSSETSF